MCAACRPGTAPPSPTPKAAASSFALAKPLDAIMSQENIPPLNAARLWSRVDDLSKITQPDLPWARRAFSDLFFQSRSWLKAQFAQAGLSVSLDAAGHLVDRRAGRTPDAQPIITGSHYNPVMSARGSAQL